MSDRIQATYRYWGESPEQLADAIRVEQTIEFPFDLAPAWIQRDVVASVEGITAVGDGIHDVVIIYDPRTAAGGVAAAAKRALGQRLDVSRCQAHRA